MFRKICFGLILLTTHAILQAQVLVNNGADITIKSGTAVKIDGKLLHRNNSHVLNNGIINLNGDYENFSIDPVVFLPGSSGLLKFSGSGTHTIDGTGPLVVPNLSIETDVNFNNLVIIENHLQFNNGNILLTYPSLNIDEGATLSGFGPNAYIKTYGNEIIATHIGTNETIIPIGTISDYLPVSIKSINGTGEAYIGLSSDVQINGNSGGTISEIEQTIKHTWELSYWGFPSTPDLDLTFQWPENAEGTSFNPSTAALSHYNGSAWGFYPIQEAVGSDPYELTQTGISEPGYFTIWSKQPELITLDLKVYLEGAYEGAEMNTTLNDNNELPLNQPFDVAPWNYNGTESVPAIPNPDIADWVLIEGRDAADAASATENTIFGRQAAFVLKNGEIVGMDGISEPSFFTLLYNQLFIVVRHRNHLPVMSANGLVPSFGNYSFDFTTSSSQAYGISSQKDLGNGNVGLYAGDADANGSIDSSDRLIWQNTAGTSGYLHSDFNLDTQVENRDKNDYWKSNLNKQSQLPQ
ncbi:MAG: hypothetical protein KDC05_06190 [Bacteroidales bacterium]|nr:hypothetical protein [Bacteroidales bacterium]